MFLMIRKRLTYANVVMTLALVFAMTGGAYAASKYLITSTKQISPKVLKSLKGAKGANGAAGLSGATGPVGPGGAAGSQGAKGETGATGTEGKAGVSVTSREVKGGEAACNKAGGAEFTAPSGKTFACNGSAAELPEVLPSKKTLKGTWDASGGALGVKGTYILATAVSFPIRVENKAGEGPLKQYIKKGEGDPEGCTGNQESPGAQPGYLCVFVTQEEHVASGLFAPSVQSVTPLGFRLAGFSSETEEGAELYGTWAVTAQ